MKARAKAKPAAGQETGFSLIELMVAMLITLIVSGAMFGLLSSGNSAFRREPEMSDRQQNIRLAMDVISKDVVNGGANMPAFEQVFTRSDAPPAGPTLNGSAGSTYQWPGSLGPAAAALRGDPSTVSDMLQVVAAEDECPSHTVDPAAPPAPGAAGAYTTFEPPAGCARAAVGPPSTAYMGMLTDNTNYWFQAVTSAVQTGNKGTFNLTATVPGSPGLPVPGGYAATGVFLYRARISRYKIAPNAADINDPNTPCLWRSTTGRFASTGGVVADPGDPGFTSAPPSTWQIVARGIEDLQVEYMDGNNVWSNTPTVATQCLNPVGAPPGDPANGGCTDLAPSVGNPYTPIIRQVRITLAARTIAPGVAGQAITGGDETRRGQLVSVIAPRAAMAALQMGGSLK